MQPLRLDPRTRGTRLPAVRPPRPARRAGIPQPRPDPGAVPQGGRAPRRRARAHHEPSGPLHDREPALQRQGTDDSVRAAGLAQASLAVVHPALHADHADPPGADLRRRRLLRAQRADGRGADRPGDRAERRGGERGDRANPAIGAGAHGRRCCRAFLPLKQGVASHFPGRRLRARGEPLTEVCNAAPGRRYRPGPRGPSTGATTGRWSRG